jgi:hypothetical protein
MGGHRQVLCCRSMFAYPKAVLVSLINFVRWGTRMEIQSVSPLLWKIPLCRR